MSSLATIPQSRWGKSGFSRTFGAEGTPTPVVVLDKVEKDLSDGWKLGIFQPKGAAQGYRESDARQTAEMVVLLLFPVVLHLPSVTPPPDVMGDGDNGECCCQVTKTV